MQKIDSCDEESIMEFPCQFPIKVMGAAEENFDLLVAGIVRRYVPDIMEGAVKSRNSQKGNYISITVTVTATSSEQLDSIYTDLTAHEKVLMAL